MMRPTRGVSSTGSPGSTLQRRRRRAWKNRVKTRVFNIASMLNLCQTHASQFDPDCTVCQSVRAVLKPEALSQISDIGDKEDIPDAAQRFAGSSTEKTPTLVLSKSTMDFTIQVFTKGKLTKNRFDEVVKKYFFLSGAQNDQLVKRLQLEHIFGKLERNPEFKKEIEFKKMFIRHIKNIRLFCLMDICTDLMRKARVHGKQSGLVYPSVPTSIKMMGPQDVVDRLSYTENLALPLPLTPDVLSGTSSVTDDDEKIIKDNMKAYVKLLETYRMDANLRLANLYNDMTGGLLKVDNLLNFHFYLFSHMDSSMQEVVRKQLAFMFKPEVRQHLLGAYATQEEQDRVNKSSTGILGGIFSNDFSGMFLSTIFNWRGSCPRTTTGRGQ